VSTVRIRRARPADLDALAMLETRFPTDRLSRASLRRLLARGRADVWVAEIYGAVVGDAVVCYRRGSRRARLYSIVTNGAHAGRGIGRALLVACEAGAVARGCVRMALEVRPDNEPALRLYRRGGYAAAGVAPAFYEDGAPALRLIKALEPRAGCEPPRRGPRAAPSAYA
jgi:ribosomal protein S18 acetylase RimI-like enzyme